MSLPSRETGTPSSQPPNTYTVQQGAELSAAALRSKLSHLTSAADHVAEIFTSNEVPFAFMGGFSMILRGSSRDTVDVDVAIGCTMDRLITVLKDQPRIIRPLGPVSGVMRIFILTSLSNLPQLHVQLDLLSPGTLGGPLSPSTSSEILTAQTPLGEKSWPVINLLSLVNSKLNAYLKREEPKDYHDLLYLMSGYGEDIYGFRGGLDREGREGFVRGFVGRNVGVGKEGSVRRVKYILGVP